MPDVLLTYANLGERLGISPEAARQLTARKRWHRSRSNAGLALVHVPDDALDEAVDRRTSPARLGKRNPARAPAVPPVNDELLKALNTLRDELAAARQDAQRVQVLEVERARLEAEVAGLRTLVDEARADRDAWRRQAERPVTWWPWARRA